MAKQAKKGRKPKPRRPYVVFAHDPGRFYSDSIVKALTKMRDRKWSRLNVTFCENARGGVVHLFSKPCCDALGTPDVLFIDGRLPNEGYYLDLVPGDTLFYTSTKVYRNRRRKQPDLRIVIFTTDYREAFRLSLKRLTDPNLYVVLVTIDFPNDINRILAIIKNSPAKSN